MKVGEKEMECQICGMVVGAEEFETLPDDWFCPDCDASKELFESKKEEGKIICKKCGFVYDPQNDVHNHNLKEKYKNLNKEEWLCPICNPA